MSKATKQWKELHLSVYRLEGFTARFGGAVTTGKGGGVDQLSLNPLTCIFLKLLKGRPRHYIMMLRPVAGR